MTRAQPMRTSGPARWSMVERVAVTGQSSGSWMAVILSCRSGVWGNRATIMQFGSWRTVLGALMLAAAVCVSGAASAQVTPAEAEALKTTLTPVGAERAGNAEGTIPAWTGTVPPIL